MLTEAKEEINQKDDETHDLTPEEAFDEAFREAIEENQENKQEEHKSEDDKEEEVSEDSQETPPQEAVGESEDKAQQDEKVVEEKSKKQPDEHKEEAPAKAFDEEAKEEQPREEEKPDFSPLFMNLENDIADPKLKKEISEFAEEMDTSAKFVTTMTTIMGNRLANYVNESFKTLIDKLNPYLEATRKQIESDHQTAVRQVHQDFDSLKNNEDVVTWIKEQPKYLQKGYMETYQNGDAGDVVDLLTRYKKDRGTDEQNKSDDLSKKREEKAQAKAKVQEKIENLSAVKTKDRPVQTRQKSINSDDFGAVFDEIVSRK